MRLNAEVTAFVGNVNRGRGQEVVSGFQSRVAGRCSAR